MRPFAAKFLHAILGRRLHTTIYERKRSARGASGRYIRCELILSGTSGHDFYVPTSRYIGSELREIRKTHR